MDATLNPLSLTVLPGEAERRYRAVRQAPDFRIMRATYAVGIARSSAYFIFDYVALGRFDPTLLVIRLVVVNAVIALALGLTWLPAAKPFAQHIGGWVFLFHLVFYGIGGTALYGGIILAVRPWSAEIELLLLGKKREEARAASQVPEQV